MKKLIAVLLAATFAAASVSVIAEEKKSTKKPTAEQCKAKPKTKGCDAMPK